jgi:hypothetical protein
VPRWTVTSEDQVMVIESRVGRVSVDIPTGAPFVGETHTIRDMRTKLGLAIGHAQSGDKGA